MLLLLSAYSPLAIIVGILRLSLLPALVLIAAGLLLGACIFIVEKMAKRRNQPQQATLQKVSPADGDVAGYLTTYILPFITLTVPGWRSAAAFAFFAVLLLAVLAQSNRLALNPWLFLSRQRVYVIDVSGTDEFALCPARTSPRPGSPVKLYRLATGLYYLEDA